MDKLFLYFSDTGNGDFVAEYLKKQGYVTKKIITKHGLPKSFFFKVFFGGFISGLNLKSKLIDYDNNISDYDEIVIGSPVWNGKLSCPINTVLSKTDFTGKKISFVLYAGGGEAPKAEKLLRKKYSDAKVTILKEPKKHPEELKKISI